MSKILVFALLTSLVVTRGQATLTDFHQPGKCALLPQNANNVFLQTMGTEFKNKNFVIRLDDSKGTSIVDMDDQYYMRNPHLAYRTEDYTQGMVVVKIVKGDKKEFVGYAYVPFVDLKVENGKLVSVVVPKMDVGVKPKEGIAYAGAIGFEKSYSWVSDEDPHTVAQTALCSCSAVDLLNPLPPQQPRKA